MKHIEARDRAFWLVIIIPFLALVPLTCFAQTKKSEAKAQVQPAPASAPFEGCYELKLSRWWPWGFGEENKYVTPPTHIELPGEHGTRGFEQDKPLIRTIPRQDRPPGDRESSFWNAKSQNQLQLTWTDGFVGVTLDLTKSKDKLNGWAHPHFDAPHFIPRIAHVTAQPIGCEADTGTSAGGEHPHNPTDQQRQSSIAATTDWQKIDAVAFSIVAPPGWEFHQLQGVDSYVGEFVGDGFALKFDFGEYSNPLKEEKRPAYVIVHKSIAGLPSKVVSVKASGHGITAIYFSRTFGGNKLCLFGQDLSSTQEELALKIFETM